MTTTLDALAVLGALMILHTIAVRLREMTGVLRRLAPGCTCPLHGLAASSTCPAHREHVPTATAPRAPAPLPDSTSAFYVPPGRNE